MREQEWLGKMEKRHFVLVHGACHGAWCWYKVATLLKSAGHEVTALDMAASGIHPKQVRELNSVTEYCEPLMEFLGSLPQEERVILVGHSLGGLCISMAMELFPKKVAAAVFVTAFMPGPDLSFLTLYQEDESNRLDSSGDTKILFDDSPNKHPNGSKIFGPQFLASHLYQLSPPEDFTLAMSLLRPTRIYGDQELLQEKTRVTKDNYGTVARVYIVCQQDNVLKHDFQLSMIERNHTNDVRVIATADHMPMFSKPEELFSNQSASVPGSNFDDNVPKNYCIGKSNKPNSQVWLLPKVLLVKVKENISSCKQKKYMSCFPTNSKARGQNLRLLV